MGAPGLGIPLKALGGSSCIRNGGFRIWGSLGAGALGIWVSRSMTQGIEVLQFSGMSITVWGLLMPMNRA